MNREPYYLAETVLGSYNLYILMNPAGSWYYSCVGTFPTKEDAVAYYENMRKQKTLISKMTLGIKK
ncbi:MAG: hypothetical protein ACLUGY_08530 [Phocaeicola massiliensis]